MTVARNKILISVVGIPPYKEQGRSIRNPCHRDHALFVKLREAAEEAMQGRRWHDGPIRMDVVYQRKNGRRKMIDYIGGIMDTLDGSHGFTFTYMPIVYQDDCQVCLGEWREMPGERDEYTVAIEFLDVRP